MHHLVPASIALLLAALPAQDPAARPAPTLPPAPEVAPSQDDLVAQKLRHLGQQQRVCFDDRAADGNLWAVGTAWKAAFDARGATVVPFFGSHAPQNFPLRLELDRATVGGEPLALTDNKPTHTDAQVRTDRGSLVEVYDTKLETLEQSFVFSQLPNRGDVRVEVGIASELVASEIPGGLRFANEHGHVDYTKAVAVDAKGARLDLPIVWTGTTARMTIPASFVEQAALPLVLDPVLNYLSLIGGAAQTNRESDVATFQANGGRTLMVWKRTWSASDNDCWGVLFDGNLGMMQTDFVIDVTVIQDWRKIAVASNNNAQNFLVVSEIRQGTVHWIGGVTVSASAAVSPVITFERDGVVGIPGNNFHPDVGGDPIPASSLYCIVFQKINGSSADIYMRSVTAAGVLQSTNPVVVSSQPEVESRPAIAKSCRGVGAGSGFQQWLVAWQSTRLSAPFDENIGGRYVLFDGSLNGPEFWIAGLRANETAPSPGTPIDIGTDRLYPVAFEVAPAAGQPRDIHLCLVRWDGGVWVRRTVNNSAASVDDRDPECDSDNNRIVVGG